MEAYDKLIDLAVKIEQEIKDEATKIYEPIQYSDIIKNSKILGKRETLNLIYASIKEERENG